MVQILDNKSFNYPKALKTLIGKYLNTVLNHLLGFDL